MNTGINDSLNWGKLFPGLNMSYFTYQKIQFFTFTDNIWMKEIEPMHVNYLIQLLA
jgi:hypothetical protein